MISKYMDHAFFTLLPVLVQIEELIGGIAVERSDM